MLYQYNRNPNFFLTELGQEGTGRINTSSYPVHEGFHFSAYFHTHIPGESQEASPFDQGISTDYDIPVYTIADKWITKWYKGKETNVIGAMSYTVWCIKNRTEWEGQCCAKK